MNTTGEAAESIVRMSLQGLEVAAKITGSGAKNFAVLLYTVMRDQQQIKGKTKLVNMLKSGKELKVFSVAEENFKKFSEEAKKYGVLYSAIIDKKAKTKDGLIDIIVRSEDASKINRIVERFKFTTLDTATIKSQIEKARNDKDKSIMVKGIEEKLVDDILTTPSKNEINEISNPYLAQAEKSPLLEHTLINKKKSEKGTKTFLKPSVREQIKYIRKEQKRKEKLVKNDKFKNKKKERSVKNGR